MFEKFNSKKDLPVDSFVNTTLSPDQKVYFDRFDYNRDRPVKDFNENESRQTISTQHQSQDFGLESSNYSGGSSESLQNME